NKYGFDGFTGSAFAQAPDNSYGNAPSNVVYLYQLYPDDTQTPTGAQADIGYVKVYVEGIGTRSGGKDATVIGQGLGRGETGVVARVAQAPGLLERQLDIFQKTNSGKPVRDIQIDIFGFSRGAAAARHCANEFLKPGCGIFKELLQPGRFGLVNSFDPAVGVKLNLIGLFDTVAAISSPERGDWSPANNDNNGVNLYLPPRCAREVIQLGARDECRLNFALNGVLSHHLQISLPGVHSDIGGGYLPNAWERLWLVEPKRIEVAAGRSLESHPQWLAMVAQAEALRASGLNGDGRIEAKAWAAAQAHHRRDGNDTQAYWLTVTLERSVRGELALVALRVMRELGVRHGVPFDEISDSDQRFKLPTDLAPVADHIIEQVLAGSSVVLDPDQERLLRSRYIHQSAHWTPTKGVMLAKPAPDNRRNVYLDQPQKGYPQ
ncbi:DUF2235 domain-containing protein, partial [Pseudomonas sp. NPDC088444]|uniref:DUF2235 domain-containing protein n=1 Tax=Pseudomonas sp. NPDC088444 TaxID=3364456 RepID=UPI00384ED7CC